MIKELFIGYSKFFVRTKEYSLVALFSGVFGAISETIAIFYLSEIIKVLEFKNSISFNEEGILNTSIIFYLLIFLSFSIISASIYFISNKYTVKSKSKLERIIRKEITDLTLEIDWPYFIQLDQGEISKTIIIEGEQIATGYMYFLSAISYILISLTYLIACLFLVRSTLLILIIYSLIAYNIFKYYSIKTKNLGRNLSSISSSIGKSSSAIFNNLKFIRSNSKENIARSDSNRIFRDYSKAYENALTASYKSKQVTEILSSIFIFVAILFIFLSNNKSPDIILSLTLFIRMAPKVYNSQTRLLDAVALISWPKKYEEKINWAFKYKNNQINEKNNQTFNKKNKLEINFKSVSYRYPESNDWIIQDSSFVIRDKELIGISGDSGSGKTTLIDLLTGLIKPTKGKTYISGIDMNDINLESWRSNLGIVFQETYLINNSIAANIALGQKKIDDRKIKNALKLSNAFEFIKKLPNGYYEPVFDRGSRFSGGQKQRIALARALYSNPKVLILDEPTSALDENSEKLFIDSLIKLYKKHTIILISHKQNILNLCDKILVIKNKKISINESKKN